MHNMSVDFVQKYPGLIVSYEQMVQSWVPTMHTIEFFLDVAKQRLPMKIKKSIDRPLSEVVANTADFPHYFGE